MASLDSPIHNPLLGGNPAPTDGPDAGGSGTGGGSGGGGGGGGNNDGKKVTSTTTSRVTEPTQTPDLASGDDAVIQFFFEDRAFWRRPRVLRDNFERAEVMVPYTIHHRVVDEGQLTPTLASLCRYMGEQIDPECQNAAILSRLVRRQTGDGLTQQSVPMVSFPIAEPTRTEPLFIKLEWNYNYHSPILSQGIVNGESTSKLFIQIQDNQEPDEALLELEDTYGNAQYDGHSLTRDNTPILPQEMRSFFDAGLGDEPSVGGGGTPTSTTATVQPSATNGVATGEGAAPISAGGGGGGLSTGAIAGIGVGAGIAVLAIIAALLWFFCLRNRRRKSKDVKGPYSAPEGQASEFMVNKETNAHITESPHSPYSDDGSLTRAADQHHYHQPQQHHSTPSYGQDAAQPYSDAPPIAAPVPRSASQQAHTSDRPVSRSGARSGTPAGNVSHLIEEGMTEEDIRRLEEEERALDDAIERAGHQRRT